MLFAAARPPRAQAPHNTLQALLDIAQHPTNNAARLFGLHKGHAYPGHLRAAPSAWVLSLVDDRRDPVLQPLVHGWQRRLGVQRRSHGAVAVEWLHERRIRAPQGIAVDQRDDVFIANHGGNSITEYPGGDPAAAITITGGGISDPFGIAVDARGNEWATDNALSSLPGGVTEFTPAGTVVRTIEGGGLSSPQGIATDEFGDKWVADSTSNSVTLVSPGGAIDPLSRSSSSGSRRRSRRR